MVWAVTNEQQAQQTARMLQLFRERLRTLDLERTCVTAMINELQEQLIQYRGGIREMLNREAEEAERVADQIEKGDTGG
jgi:hypothetical protein